MKKVIIIISIYFFVILWGLFACQHFLLKPYACKNTSWLSCHSDDTECLKIYKKAQDCSLSNLFDTLYWEI